jgi:hypothetical protein
VIEFRAVSEYNETEIAGDLAAIAPEARQLFACACAERLMPAFRWFCDRKGSTDFGVVREALDAAWSSAGTSWSAGASEVAALVPDVEEGGMALASAVAQNAVACVAYALEASQAGDVQNAVWAARQLYEAADAVVQQGSAVNTYVEDIAREPPLQLVVQGIYAALDAAATLSSADLRASARQDGEAFLGFVDGSADGSETRTRR